jgi:hypothetical protein
MTAYHEAGSRANRDPAFYVLEPIAILAARPANLAP